MYSCVMHKKAITLATLALIAGLTGCAGGTAEAGVENTPVQSAEVAVESEAPLVAAETSPEDAQYLDAMRRVASLPETEDAKLLEIGQWICDELDSGKTPAEITVIDGASDYDNAEAVFVPSDIYCTEYREITQARIHEVIEGMQTPTP